MRPERPDATPVEHPRHEPEIIPPGQHPRAAGGTQGFESVFVRFEQRDGAQRIYVARPGWPWIVLGLLAVGVVAALVFFLLAGLVLVWIPLLIVGALAALGAGAVRERWGRVRAWWTGTR